MAIDDFWINLRNAASVWNPTDSHDSAKWFNPRAVDNFDANDFRFLDEDQYAALRENVERFRSAAGQSNQPTRPQIEQGRAAFGEILRLLQPHTFHDAESLRTQVLLRRELGGKLPKWVTQLSCETGLDHMGEEAIWIWLDVTEEAVGKRKVEKHGIAMIDAVRDAYQRIGGRRWPFVRFRSPDAFARPNGDSSA